MKLWRKIYYRYMEVPECDYTVIPSAPGVSGSQEIPKRIVFRVESYAGNLHQNQKDGEDFSFMMEGNSNVEVSVQWKDANGLTLSHKLEPLDSSERALQLLKDAGDALIDEIRWQEYSSQKSTAGSLNEKIDEWHRASNVAEKVFKGLR